MIPRIKICCMGSIEETRTVIEFGADAVGLVGKMPSGPGPISDRLIYQIAKAVSPPIATFLLTSETTAGGIIDHHRRTRTNTIQIVDRIETSIYQMLRRAIPAIKLVQVVHVVDNNSIDEAVAVSQFADAILLDSGNPSLKIKQLGGTGRIHDWKLSRKIRQAVKIPVFLAGGLNHENVREAYEAVEPFGIDVCSGVRTRGKLDSDKLENFFNSLLK